MKREREEVSGIRLKLSSWLSGVRLGVLRGCFESGNDGPRWHSGSLCCDLSSILFVCLLCNYVVLILHYGCACSLQLFILFSYFFICTCIL